ncbi:MAG: hypothetical protein HYX41_02965 [Bdellovibrio sp.]|nr:hypothetical protein [Bdellovibrio sp.]
MRREPWHERLPAAEHYLWFQNLVELHELTNLWLKEVQIEYSQHAVHRGFSKRVTENLWMLNSLTEHKFEDYLDDTTPEDVLARLEHAVWATQAWTLNHFRIQTPEDSREAIETVLEQICWKAGRRCAEKRWSRWIQKDGKPGTDLRDILLAFQDSPLSRSSRQESFLLRRGVQNLVEVELLTCPHRLPYHETHEVADWLCRLHWNFLKGYAYALNSKTVSEFKISQPRCVHRWHLEH